MDFFTDELGVTKEKLLGIATKWPVILSYSTENIQRKVSYLKEDLGLSNTDVRKTLTCISFEVFLRD